MSKFKTILFWSVVILALAGASWSYFYLRENKKPGLKAIDVLSDSAVCVVSSNNFIDLSNKLTNQNLIWKEINSIKEFSRLDKQLNFFDSVIRDNEALKSFFGSRPVYLALYKTPSSSNFVISFNLNELSQEEDFLKEFSAGLKANKDEQDVYSFACPDINYYLKCKRGVVLISNNKSYTERAFNDSEKKQVNNKSFSGLKKLLDKENLCNVYADHRHIGAKTGIQNEKPLFTGASVFEVEFGPDEVTFNGFNAPDTSSVLNSLSGQQAQACDFLGVLPFNLISYKAIGISDYELWARHSVTTEQSRLFWRAINDSAMFNVEKQLKDNIDGKIIEVQLRYSNALSKALVIEIKDSAEVNEVVKYISDSVATEQNVRYGKLKSSGLTAALCGSVFSLNDAYAFVYENYFVITENKEVNDYYLHSLLNNSTVAQNELFAAYAKDNLAQPFNYQYYCVLNKSFSIVTKALEFIKADQLKSFEKLSDFSINFSNYKTVLQFRSNLKYQQNNQTKESPGLWAFEADTLIQSKIWPFLNYKTGENELLVQDAKNGLYLVNETGNQLWKKQIIEAVVSDIFIVDAFKNGKLQLLFNSANYLHLIDRNGNYVEGFPVKLPAKATNQMVVFDYENTRDYRLFVACDDKTIYNLNINGSKNESFAPVKTLNEVTLPVKYAKVGASDYLISADVNGKIYVYSRRGAGRIDFSNNLIEQCRNFYVDAANNNENSKLVYLDDKNSLLESVSLTDKKSVVKLAGEFENAIYSFDWIDDDKKPDIMILDRSKLTCYDFAGNELFVYESEDYTYKNAVYFFDTDGAYFLLNTLAGEIHMIPAGTKSITKKIKGDGIPFVFDLFKDGKKYLLVSEGATLKCVLLK